MNKKLRAPIQDDYCTDPHHLLKTLTICVPCIQLGTGSWKQAKMFDLIHFFHSVSDLNGWKHPSTSYSVTIQFTVWPFTSLAQRRMENVLSPIFLPSLFTASIVLKVKTHPGLVTGDFLSPVLVLLGHCRTRLLYLGKASGKTATGRSAQTRLDLPLSFRSVDYLCSIYHFDWQKMHKLGSTK